MNSSSHPNSRNSKENVGLISPRSPPPALFTVPMQAKKRTLQPVINQNQVGLPTGLDLHSKNLLSHSLHAISYVASSHVIL